MPLIDESTLKKHIKNRMLLPVYLLFGADSFLKQHYQKELMNSAVGDTKLYNFEKIDGKALNIDELSEKCEQMPFMHDKRCICIDDFNIETANAKDIEKLKQLLSDPSPTAVLIFYCTGVEINYERPSAKWRSVITLINKCGACVDLSYRNKASLVKLLCDSSRKKGCEMNERTARYLIERTGMDMLNLSIQRDKLCVYKKSGEITIEDVDKMTVPSLEATSFQLAKAVINYDADSALKLLDVLYTQKTEPVIILSAVISNFIDIYIAKCAEAARVSSAQATTDFGLAKTMEFRIKNGARAQINVKRLRKSLDILSETDKELKFSNLDNRISLEKMIIKLCINKG